MHSILFYSVHILICKTLVRLILSFSPAQTSMILSTKRHAFVFSPCHSSSVWMKVSDLFVDIDIWCLFWSVILIVRESEASFGKSKHSQRIIKATDICLSLSWFMQVVSLYSPFPSQSFTQQAALKNLSNIYFIIHPNFLLLITIFTKRWRDCIIFNTTVMELICILIHFSYCILNLYIK